VENTIEQIYADAVEALEAAEDADTLSDTCEHNILAGKAGSPIF
jgi:hypothetical protein